MMSSSIPAFVADDLNGQIFRVPDDYAGRFNLILMPFSLRQQAAVNTWLPFAKWLTRHVAAVEYYEHPVIQTHERPRKDRIDGWMRQGISNRDARARTITLYTDIDQLAAQLGLPNARRNATLLLDHAGGILWMGAGPYQEAQGQAVYDVIQGQAGSNPTQP